MLFASIFNCLPANILTDLWLLQTYRLHCITATTYTVAASIAFTTANTSTANTSPGKSTCKYEPAEGVYEGGRKCLPGFCGGKEFEKEILGSLKPEELTKLYDLLKWLKDHP